MESLVGLLTATKRCIVELLKYMQEKFRNYGEKFGVRTWIEIDRRAIKHNYKIFRSCINPETKLMSVVKSNAYGHGLIDFSKEVASLGADWLGADSIVEALHLREVGIKKPILVLGYTLPKRFVEAVENNLSLSISSFESLNNLLKRAKGFKAAIRIHVKVDTGMHRQGFFPEDMEKVCALIEGNSKIIFEGIFTHFAAAKNPSFPDSTNKQIEEFEKALSVVDRFGFKPIRHASATAGTLLYPKAHYDMVRIGIGMYGIWPSKEVEKFFTNKLNLKPVLTWKTLVGEVKTLPNGGGVGYDFTESLPKNSKIAVCPIGYWHGYGRVFSSIGNVLVNGKRVRIVGRVSMDMIILDVTKVANVKVGDEVVLIGRQGGDEVKADELADISDSLSSYEILTRTNPLIKRVYI